MLSFCFKQSFFIGLFFILATQVSFGGLNDLPVEVRAMCLPFRGKQLHPPRLTSRAMCSAANKKVTHLNLIRKTTKLAGTTEEERRMSGYNLLGRISRFPNIKTLDLHADIFRSEILPVLDVLTKFKRLNHLVIQCDGPSTSPSHDFVIPPLDFIKTVVLFNCVLSDRLKESIISLKNLTKFILAHEEDLNTNSRLYSEVCTANQGLSCTWVTPRNCGNCNDGIGSKYYWGLNIDMEEFSFHAPWKPQDN